MSISEVIETAGKAISWIQDNKRQQQKSVLWKLLSDAKTNQRIGTAYIFEVFRSQVESPLFSDEQEVETVLRSMHGEGVVFDMHSKYWYIAPTTGFRW